MSVHTTPAGVDFVRTPDERFAGLDDFPYQPHYVDVDGLRMAYVDEGPADAAPVVLLHGEPSWGYLYRRMLPVLLEAGHRCIVPDLIGFGRSDKPTDIGVYTYAQHVAWLEAFLDRVVTEPATLFVQDWGGLLGLRIAGLQPERFSRLVVGNTALPTGESAGPAFDAWVGFSQSSQMDDVGGLFRRAVAARELSDAEVAAYDAPFPDAQYRAGAIAFPPLVPVTTDHAGVEENQRAWAGLERFTKPVLVLWAPEDPVLGHFAPEFRDRIPGAAGQPHREFRPGGHFLQDDCGPEIAAAMVAWLAA